MLSFIGLYLLVGLVISVATIYFLDGYLDNFVGFCVGIVIWPFFIMVLIEDEKLSVPTIVEFGFQKFVSLIKSFRN